MATPRKAWIRIATAMRREPWPRDLKLTWMFIMMDMNDRWARDGLSADEACEITYSMGQIKDLTGKGRADIALKSLRSLVEVAPMSLRLQGDFVVIHAPKVAKFQRWDPQTRAKTPPELPPTPTPTQDAHVKGKSTRKPQARRTPLPEPIPPEMRAELDAIASEGGISPDALITALRDYAASSGNQYANWPAAVRIAVRSGYGWVPKPSAERKPNYAERTANETKEAVRRVLEGARNP